MGKKRIVVDLDGVICNEGSYLEYSHRVVLSNVKERLKKLSEEYTIVVWTSRVGEESFWETISWLKQHGLDAYISCVLFDKPRAEYYVDDRSVVSLEDVNV